MDGQTRNPMYHLIWYRTMRDELTTQNGLVFKGEQIVIPIGLQADMGASVV